MCIYIYIYIVWGRKEKNWEDTRQGGRFNEAVGQGVRVTECVCAEDFGSNREVRNNITTYPKKMGKSRKHDENEG